MTIKDYKELQIWQKGIEITDRIYSITRNFPQDELYGLTSQMRRAAVSIPSNIAEGFARQHRKEYTQFLFTALGSCAELETQSIIAERQHYLIQSDKEELLEALNHQARMTMNLIKSL